MIRKLVTAAVVASVARFTLGVAAPAAAAITVFNGTIDRPPPTTLSPEAVAVVMLVDQTATPGSGAIVGEQRIDGVASLPVAFEVPYDDARIDPTHSYAASPRSSTATPSGRHRPRSRSSPVDQRATSSRRSKRDAEDLASITGAIAAPAGESLTDDAVAIAVLIKVETGTLVDIDTIIDIGPDATVPFALDYESDLVDPAAHYVVRAAIVDGADVWGAPDSVDAITDGVPAAAP